MSDRLVTECLLCGFFAALVIDGKGNAAEQERFFPGSFTDQIVFEFGRRKDLRIRLEADGGTGPVGPAEILQLADLLAAVAELHPDKFAVMGHFNRQPLTEGIDDGCPDAVQTARGLVAAFGSEFAAGMQNRKNNLQGIHTAFVHACRHAAALIADGYTAVAFKRYIYTFAEAVEGFVHCVVNNFPDQMMQTV